MKNEIDIATMQMVTRSLESNGIEFVVDGCLPITADDIPEFLRDPELFIAKSNGVSKDDYIAYKNNVPLRCAGTTRKRRQCKHLVNGGGTQLGVQGYANLRGGYCVIHGG